jgi:hypothetical protein
MLRQEAGMNSSMLRGYTAFSGVELVGTYSLCFPDDVLCEGSWAGYAASGGMARRLARLNWTEYVNMNTSSNSFSYTDTDGLTLSGPITRNGRRLSASFSSNSFTALENYLAGKILDQMTAAGNNPGWVDVAIDRSSLRMMLRPRIGRRGGPSSLGLSWSLRATIDTGIGNSAGLVRSRMILYE